jgi:signal transduction histidine kinase
MSKSKILIVEDESIIALDIKTSLIESGYEVVAIAVSGNEAIEQAKCHQPNLILMDIRLRDSMDGIEAAGQISQISPVPIIFLTAHTDKDTLDRAKKTEPFGYLIKPFDDYSLITTIEIALARYQAEEAVRESLRQQQAFNEVRSRFLAVVSHEFRNPLNSILFSSELLERYGATIDSDRKSLYFKRIHGAVQRMNQLLDDVLVIGATDAGKLECNPTPLDLKQFCQELLSEIQPEEAQICPVIFGYEVVDHLANVKPQLDRKLLNHILGNLLSNAVKYSRPGIPVLFQVHLRNQEVVFQIQDQGIGIPESDLASLFSDFHRASNVKSIPGTGLGLSIVKQCVEIHGGTIEVHSIENQGSTFTVVLPVEMLKITHDVGILTNTQ